ncbi:MAG: L-carnitine dehydrogenase [Pseudomonadota bacterium]|nr:MAG: L-carnitine dehydrogenase [Pseudomonadota bacterium]
MSTDYPEEVLRVTCVGAGTIGSAWAAYFLSRGLDVVATDPMDGARERVKQNIDEAWPKLERLGLSAGASRDRLVFTESLEEAVRDADFIQESAPDDEPLKIDLIARIDAACRPGTVIASSSSKFLPSRMSAQCGRPERVIVGHPFVPAYLVPLVEVVGVNRPTRPHLTGPLGFYRRVGKKPLRLKKEIEAYIANRLQHAIYLEALSLVDQGVCDYEDIDKAVTWGPGLRWAVQGPILHRHLGGGKGGVRHMIDHFGWDGVPGEEETFIDAVEKRWNEASITELESWRDDNLLLMLEGLEPPPGET